MSICAQYSISFSFHSMLVDTFFSSRRVCFDQNKNCLIMKNIIASRILNCIFDFDVMRLSRTMLCMWNQSLLRKSILSFNIIKHDKVNDQKNEHQRVNFVVVDCLCTSIMNNKMNRITFHVLTWFNQQICEQNFYNFFKFDLVEL